MLKLLYQLYRGDFIDYLRVPRVPITCVYSIIEKNVSNVSEWIKKKREERVQKKKKAGQRISTMSYAERGRGKLNGV